ncbi:carbon-nitrogen hydrolase [Poronia punctata]|nr:carbon-nitrogen hydrolase [Poronia punctata]
MRIGCLQFAPRVGVVDDNVGLANAVLDRTSPKDLDLLVLPELAFTGYNFKSFGEIRPFLERQGSGTSAVWAKNIALKYNCIVTVGYPEKVDADPERSIAPNHYNSALIVNADCKTIGNYRKSFLYYTDYNWASEGKAGFFNGFIPELGTVSMGICMDLNPYLFLEDRWNAFEFASHCLKVKANLIILTMAWLTSEAASDFTLFPDRPCFRSLAYWIIRLGPLIRAESEEETIVVFCNRAGIEDEAVYAGTSAVIGIRDGQVILYGVLGRGKQDLLMVDTEATPDAKIIHRFDSQLPVPETTEAFYFEIEKLATTLEQRVSGL